MFRTVALAVITALALAGCASNDAADSPAAPTSTFTPSATPTATPAATGTPAPTATPAPAPTSAPTQAPPAAAGCETVLSDAEYASLAEDGLTLNPDVYVLDDVMKTLMAEGFGCYWSRSGGDVRVWFAQANHDDATWATRRQELLDAGWTQTDTPVPGVLQAPADHDPDYSPVVVHRDGVTYYASYDRFLGSVAALLG